MNFSFLTRLISFQPNTSADKYPALPSSIWPVMLAAATGITLFLCTLTIHQLSFREFSWWSPYLITGCWLHLFGIVSWLINVGIEGRLGYHSLGVQDNLRQGFKLFIVSEAILFASFFGSFFYGKAVTPDSDDFGLIAVDAVAAPTINTIILITSGMFAGYAHKVFTNKWRPLFGKASWSIGGGLIIAVVLGLLFTKLQFDEYKVTTFSIMDGIFGGVFFLATGFHGAHVIIGSIFLLSVIARYILGFLTFEKGFVGFDCAVWYWHFVDAIWIGLYLMIYIWGSGITLQEFVEVISTYIQAKI